MAVTDVAAGAAAAFAAARGCPAEPDLGALLARHDVEVVCVCVPSGLHAAIGIQAAKAGKHLVVEKPIDVSLDAADRLIEAARAAGVALTVISQHRFDLGLIELKRLLDGGALGRLVLGEASTKWYRTQGVLRQRRVARHVGDGRRVADEPGRPLRRPAPLVHGPAD